MLSEGRSESVKMDAQMSRSSGQRDACRLLRASQVMQNTILNISQQVVLDVVKPPLIIFSLTRAEAQQRQQHGSLNTTWIACCTWNISMMSFILGFKFLAQPQQALHRALIGFSPMSASLFCSLAVIVCFFTFRDVPLPQMALDAMNRAYYGLVLRKSVRAQYEVEQLARDAANLQPRFIKNQKALEDLTHMRNQIEFKFGEPMTSQRMRRLKFVVKIKTFDKTEYRGPHNVTSPNPMKIVSSSGSDAAPVPAPTVLATMSADGGLHSNVIDEVVSAAPVSADATTWLIKVMLARDKYPEAVCNDGSPAAFYHQLGLLNSRDWIVHLEVRCAQSGLPGQTPHISIQRPAKHTLAC
jgi:hypothetical protein